MRRWDSCRSEESLQSRITNALWGGGMKNPDLTEVDSNRPDFPFYSAAVRSSRLSILGRRLTPS